MSTINLEKIENLNFVVEFKNGSIKELTTYEYEKKDLVDLYHVFFVGRASRYVVVNDSGTGAIVLDLKEIQTIDIRELY